MAPFSSYKCCLPDNYYELTINSYHSLLHLTEQQGNKVRVEYNDGFFSNHYFQAFFKNSTRSVIIKANPPHFTIVAVSDNYIALSHRKREEMLQKDFFEIFPGNAITAAQQDVLLQSFLKVIADKEIDEIPIYEYQIFLPEKGDYITQYWSNRNEPTFDNAGNVAYIIRTVTNVTENILSQQVLEKNTQLENFLLREQELNEVLETTNEELRAANEDLYVSQTNLTSLTNELEERIISRTKDLAEKEEYLRLAVASANLGTWMLEVDTANIFLSEQYRLMMGLPLQSKVSLEEASRLVEPAYQSSFTNAITNAIKNSTDIDLLYPITHGFTGKRRWIRGIGKLFFDNEKRPVNIIGLNIDTTEQENIREALQSLNEELTSANEEMAATNEELVQAQTDYLAIYDQLVNSQRELLFTIGAAELATFDLNAETGRFSGNNLLKEWFGLQPNEEIELHKATDMIAETDRTRVVKAIREALHFESGGNYDIEYTISNPKHPAPRTVKAKGKTRFDENGKPICLSGILQDVTEQKRDEQRKNDFIGMVSHEMKTPVTSLSGYLQLLKIRSQIEDDFTLNMLDKAGRQVAKITTLINGFLNVSRLESGKIQIDKKRFDMAMLMKEIEEEIQSTINSHKVIFAPVETTWVNADRDKINQVISNLISNAVKYSPANTIINVACVTLDGCATVSVKDKGIGIKEEDKPKLFDRFYRANEGTTTASGFGIGLYLCSEIIQRHDDKIWVESEVGKGSTFIFSLPVVL